MIQGRLMNTSLLLLLLIGIVQFETSLFVKAFTFQQQQHSKYALKSSSLSMSGNGNGNDKVPGSFFNRVPDKDDNDNDDGSNQKKEEVAKPKADVAGSFDQSISDLMKKRNEKPLAASPSTIGGKPTKGFGKASAPAKSSKKKEYIPIGPPDVTTPTVKPANDINNLEYDDQGYTLYKDEKTGEKSRVFEALIEYPCKFKVKIVGANEGTFVSEMVQLVAESCNVTPDKVDYSERKNGKWISLTVHAPVESAEMLYALYENIDRDPRVKFKF